jgi:hypothetical protein
MLSKVCAANGKATTLVGHINDACLVGTRAAQLGRMSLGSSAVYTTTNGGQAKPVNDLVTPGKVELYIPRLILSIRPRDGCLSRSSVHLG